MAETKLKSFIFYASREEEEVEKRTEESLHSNPPNTMGKITQNIAFSSIETRRLESRS